MRDPATGEARQVMQAAWRAVTYTRPQLARPELPWEAHESGVGGGHVGRNGSCAQVGSLELVEQR